MSKGTAPPSNGKGYRVRNVRLNEQSLSIINLTPIARKK